MEEVRREALNFLTTYNDGEWIPVIQSCERIEPFNGKVASFLDHCTACGGNWGGMFLSGIKELWPSVYEAIPQKMGSNAFVAIAYTLTLCGVDCR